MADVKEKLCPFRVFREKTHFQYSQGEATTEKFYDCLGEKCAAYYKGGCLRLIPPALLIDDGNMSLADAEKLQEEMRNALVAPAPVEPPEPWPSCSTCANQETKAGCKDCVLNADNRRTKETLGLNWVPKEVPW